MRRMDRYESKDVQRTSRMDKNRELYQNVSNNVVYANITDVTNANAFEINNNNEDNYKTRESYQQMKKYQNIENVPKTKKELDDFNHLYQKKENKIYDINTFLEEARKNRETDDLEEKRRLKNNAYNVLAGLTKKDLEKYREEKKNRVITPEEEEIRELTDTIISKTLAGEIDQATSVDLLSDLMATGVLDKIEAPEEKEEEAEEVKEEEKEIPKDEIDETILTLSKQVLDSDDVKEVEKKSKEPVTEKTFEEKDTEFYTRSMDLSDKDFGIGEDKEKKLPFIVKFLLVILILAVLAVAGYFIYQKFM